MQTVIEAINFAAKAHENQRRKNAKSTPYINHPIEVMAILSNANVTCCNTLAAAVLHDVVEDCGITEQQIRDKFGDEITTIVMECSDDKTDTKVNRKRNQILHAVEISNEAKLVKMADKLSNISQLSTDPPISWSSEVIYGYYVWSYAVCKNLFEVNDEKFTSSANIIAGQLNNIYNSYNIFELSDQQLEEQLEAYYLTIGK